MERTKSYSQEVVRIAKVAHEVNRAYCASQGDHSLAPWDEVPVWQRTSICNGVEAILEGRVKTPQESHESWVREKLDTGWVYGPEKDPVRRTHPCMVSYEKLSPEHRAKDYIFFAVVVMLAETLPA